MVESDLAFHIFQIDRIRRIVDLNRRIQYINDSFRTGQRLLHILDQIGESCYRLIEKGKMQQEGYDIFDL